MSYPATEHGEGWIGDWEHHYSPDEDVHVRADWSDPESPIDLGVVDLGTNTVEMWMGTPYLVAAAERVSSKSNCSIRRAAASLVAGWVEGNG